MRWRKLGRIYAPDGRIPWARSHAANPVAEQVEGDLYRVYFSTRDELNRSSIGFVEIDIRSPNKIVRESENPVLSPGNLAMFDDSGASIGCIVPVGNRRYLYYMGWHLTVMVPWRNAIGLAVSEAPAGPFTRFSTFPIVALNDVDPYTISYPWVAVANGKFHMWYGSNIAWGAKKHDMRHLIKFATSDDGIHWVRHNSVAIDFSGPEEYAICKPCVRKDGDMYRMWFCARGQAYRIYYAESDDGLSWRRSSDPHMNVSDAGWDSEMVEYPFVFDHGGERYMLYAGNGFGKTGFGIAVLEKP
jgi:predicted GH43/DUF377 family glycosyl hydrolase